MIKHLTEQILFREPSIIDENAVMDMRKEFISTYCKFNGTSNLNLYNNYIDWLAHTINQNNCNNLNKFSYLVFDNCINKLIGMIEITISHQNNIHRAHIVTCIRPNARRQGYSKIVTKKSIYQCNSFGIKKEFITFEHNNKASNDTMSKIIDF